MATMKTVLRLLPDPPAAVSADPAEVTNAVSGTMPSCTLLPGETSGIASSPESDPKPGSDLAPKSDLTLELHFENGQSVRRTFALPLLIGRDERCALTVRSWRVARRHARLLRRENEVWVEDEGALLGTTVNGRRVATYGPVQLGDEIVIGPCLLRVLRLPRSGTTSIPEATVVELEKPHKKQSERFPGVDEINSDGPIGGMHGLPANRRPQTGQAPIAIGQPGDPDTAGAGAAAMPLKAPTALRQAPSCEDDRGRHATSDAADSALDEGIAQECAASRTAAVHRRRLHEGLLAALRLRRQDISRMSDTALRAQATDELTRLIEADPVLPGDVDKVKLVRELVDEAVGLGPLEALLADPDISEIMVNRHDEIFVERRGRLMRHPAGFSSEQAVLGVIERIVAPLGRRIDDSTPMVDARLRDGSRVNAVIAPVALRGASMTIRKFPARRLGMEDLLRAGSLDGAMAEFLSYCVRQRKNLLVSGGTGSGKTSLLNILSNAIPDGERIVTIEDAAELRLNHAHLVSLEARPANQEGQGRVDIRDLVRNALRMRPDRIVVGECRGAEAFDMLAAMNTGHEGSLTTLHANSPRDALARLETMILMAGMDLPLAAIREHIASSMDFIIQLVRSPDGHRFISAITELSGLEGGRIQLQDVFRGQGGPPLVFAGCGLIPDCLASSGPLDIALFSRRTEVIPPASAW